MGTTKANKAESLNVSELLEEIERIKLENENLKKAIGEVTVPNQVLKSANDVQKNHSVK